MSLPSPRVPVGGQRAAPLHERALGLGLLGAGVVSVLTTLGILAVLTQETLAFFQTVSLVEFLTDTQWTPLFATKRFGILALVSGTLLTSLIAMLVAVPLGLLAAIYLSELCAERTRRALKPLLELLAGVPTVVYGYFALAYATPLLQKVVPELSSFNALGPGVVMGFMITPIICSLSEDAIYAVPRSLREGAYALGAGRLPTLFRVVLPAARSGILAALLLGVSRAIGETMIVAIAAGQQPRFTLDPRVPIETMTAYIVKVSMGDTPTGTLEYRTIFAVGATLFVFTLAMNMLGQRLARGARRAG